MSLLKRMEDQWKRDLIESFSKSDFQKIKAEEIIYPDPNQKPVPTENIVQLILRIEAGLKKPRVKEGALLYDSIIYPQNNTPEKLVIMLTDLYLVLGIEIKANGVAQYNPMLDPTSKKQAYDRLLQYGCGPDWTNRLENHLYNLLTSESEFNTIKNSLFKNINAGMSGKTLFIAVKEYLPENSVSRIESLDKIQYDSSLAVLIKGPDGRKTK